MALDPGTIREAERFGMPEYMPLTMECDCCATVICANDEDNEVRYCAQCGHEGCVDCLVKDEDSGEWFCDTDSTGKLQDSECYQMWLKENPIQKRGG